jgi:hypothetical protein
MLSEYNLHRNIWNTSFWNVLYDSAFRWKPSNKSNIKNFFESFFIPCDKCQIHYNEYKTNSPISLDWNISDIVGWVFTLHNNIRISNSMRPLSFDYTIEMYNRHHSNRIIYFSLGGRTTCDTCR